MSAERAELRLIRESLESVVAPQVVSSVIFEALSAAGGQIAEGAEGALAFVDGPVRRALQKRLGDDADPIVDELARMLSQIAPAKRPSARELDVTREVYLDARPVIVFVISSSSGFADQLQAALGEQRVTTVLVPSLEHLHRHLQVAAPPIVLVDAAEFAPIEPDDLASALVRLPSTTVRAIWGADLPFGGAVLRALVARKVPATPLDRREGIDPLLDLVRSRRAS